MSDQSESINELAAALAKAQGEITGALKDSSNPFFKSKYADLASCWDACRAQLSKNNLAVIQTTQCRDGQVFVVTTLAHSSGQWLRGELPVKAKDDGAQAQGSGITYARRYALAAIVGLAQIDDDAEAAHGRANPSADKAKDLAARFMAAHKNKSDAGIYAVHASAQGDQDLYEAAWELISASDRRAIKDAIARQKALAQPKVEAAA